MEKPLQNKPRYVLLDAVRGLTLISMVAYHTVWDMVYLFGAKLPWYEGTAGRLWQQSICFTFILLSGFCWPLGRHPLRRGLEVSAAGVLVTAVTLLFMPEEPIIFGILTLIGACMLLLIPLDRVLRRTPPAAGLAVSLALFAFVRHINAGFVGFGAWRAALPAALYHGWPATFLGFLDKAFYSADYFPMLPWLLLFLCGYFGSRLWKKSGRRQIFAGVRIPILPAVGRWSLWIYLLHQPVIYLVLYLVCVRFV